MKKAGLMRNSIGSVLLVLLLSILCSGNVTHAESTGPILGILFSQPPTDNVQITGVDHFSKDVTNEVFGTLYTNAATERCTALLASIGLSLQYMVRYRQDPLLGWEVWCYTGPDTYVQFSGMEYGQPQIDAAVARAQQLMYPQTAVRP